MSESASGDANGSCTDSDKEFSCPSCSGVFDTDAGVKQHHYAAHGESIAGELIECDWCGDTKRKRPSHVSDDHNFCGRDCWAEWNSEKQKDKVEYNCDYCGSQFKTHPYRVEESDRLFCPDSDCYGEWQSENAIGKDARHWEGGEVAVECKQCGDIFPVRQHRAEDATFCGKPCLSVWMSENLNGENSPHYDPHKTNQYGPNWDEQAEKCRERDGYRCQSCGKHQRDNYRALIAHHIVPRKRYIGDDGIYDYEEGNKLGNLVSLCDSCHQQWEGLYLKPQLV